MSKNTQESKPDTVAILQSAKAKKLELNTELKLLLKDKQNLSAQFGFSAIDDISELDLDKAIANLGTPLAVIEEQKDASKKIPLNPEKALESSMEDSLKRLKDVGSQAVDFGKKTPEESQKLLENLAREQERFYVSMKIARIAQTQLMIDSCESISAIERDGGDPAEIAKHTEALKRNLGRLGNMPSSADLEMQNNSISKLVALYALTTHFIPPITDVEVETNFDRLPDSMRDRYMYANISMAGSISQAFAVSIQPFTKFLKPQNQASFNPPQTVEELSEEVFKTAKKVSSDNAKSIDKENIKKIDEAQKIFKEKLKDAQEKLDLKSKKKPLVKRFFTFVTFGIYSGGKPEDVTKEKQEVSSLKAIIGQNDEYLSSKDSRGENSKILDKSLEAFQAATVVKPEEVDLKDLIAAAKTFADDKEKEDSVVQAIQKKRQVTEKDVTQKSDFSDVVSKSFEKRFTIAEAVEAGDVTAKKSAIAVALKSAKGLADLIPIPGAKQAVSVLFSIAEFANQAKEEARNRNVAGFAQSSSESEEVKDLREKTVAKIAEKLHDHYSERTDDKSPLDALTSSGAEKFAKFLVDEVIDQIANFKMPADTPKDLGLDREKLYNSAEYRDQISREYADDVTAISKDYGLKPDINNLGKGNGGALDKLIERIDCKRYTEYMTDHLVSAVIQGRESGMVSKATEISNKAYFTEEDLTNPVKDQILTVQGLVKRVGIVTSDGNCYVSNERDKDAQGLGSKYGFRKATKDEEKSFSEAKSIPGYSEYVSIQGRLTSEKEKFVESLTVEDFGNDSKKFDKKAQIVDNFFKEYHEAKAKDPKVTLPKFIVENPLITNSDPKRTAELNASLTELKDTSKLAESIKPENAPDQKDFTAKKLLAIDALKKPGLALRDGTVKDADEVVISVVESYKAWKEKEGNKGLGHKDFFKSSSSPIENGKRSDASTVIGIKVGNGEVDLNRKYFNESLKQPLTSLLESYDKMAGLGITPVILTNRQNQAVATSAAVIPEVPSKPVKLEKSPEELAKLKEFDIQGAETKSILSNIKTESTDLLPAMAAKISGLIRKISSVEEVDKALEVASKTTGVELGSLGAVGKSTLKLASSLQGGLTNSENKNEETRSAISNKITAQSAKVLDKIKSEISKKVSVGADKAVETLFGAIADKINELSTGIKPDEKAEELSPKDSADKNEKSKNDAQLGASTESPLDLGSLLKGGAENGILKEIVKALSEISKEALSEISKEALDAIKDEINELLTGTKANEKSKNDVQEYTEYYEASKKICCDKITTSDLKDAIPLSDGESASKKINALLNNFVSIYHEQVMRGATKPDLDTFVSGNLPVNGENELVVGWVKDLAESYSQMRLAEAISKKTAAEESVVKNSAAKESLLQLLTPEDFGKNKANYEKREETVDKFLQKFENAKEKNKELDLREYFKENPFIADIGTAKKPFFGTRVPDAARKRFDVIAEALQLVVNTSAVLTQEKGMDALSRVSAPVKPVSQSGPETTNLNEDSKNSARVVKEILNKHDVVVGTKGSASKNAVIPVVNKVEKSSSGRGG